MEEGSGSQGLVSTFARMDDSLASHLRVCLFLPSRPLTTRRPSAVIPRGGETDRPDGRARERARRGGALGPESEQARRELRGRREPRHARRDRARPAARVPRRRRRRRQRRHRGTRARRRVWLARAGWGHLWVLFSLAVVRSSAAAWRTLCQVVRRAAGRWRLGTSVPKKGPLILGATAVLPRARCRRALTLLATAGALPRRAARTGAPRPHARRGLRNDGYFLVAETSGPDVLRHLYRCSAASRSARRGPSSTASSSRSRRARARRAARGRRARSARACSRSSRRVVVTPSSQI